MYFCSTFIADSFIMRYNLHDYYTDPFDAYKVCVRAFLLNGKVTPYDVCSADSLEKATNYYQRLGYSYIGSGHTYYINGVTNVHDKLHHFFYKITTHDFKPSTR